jgi:hypothetical protein
VNEKRLRPEITNKICKRLWELAQIEPERTRGSLKGQVDCCEQMYRLFKFAAVERTGKHRPIQDKRAQDQSGRSREVAEANLLVAKNS